MTNFNSDSIHTHVPYFAVAETSILGIATPLGNTDNKFHPWVRENNASSIDALWWSNMCFCAAVSAGFLLCLALVVFGAVSALPGFLSLPWQLSCFLLPSITMGSGVLLRFAINVLMNVFSSSIETLNFERRVQARLGTLPVAPAIVHYNKNCVRHMSARIQILTEEQGTLENSLRQIAQQKEALLDPYVPPQPPAPPLAPLPPRSRVLRVEKSAEYDALDLEEIALKQKLALCKVAHALTLVLSIDFLSPHTIRRHIGDITPHPPHDLRGGTSMRELTDGEPSVLPTVRFRDKRVYTIGVLCSPTFTPPLIAAIFRRHSVDTNPPTAV